MICISGNKLSLQIANNITKRKNMRRAKYVKTLDKWMQVSRVSRDCTVVAQARENGKNRSRVNPQKRSWWMSFDNSNHPLSSLHTIHNSCTRRMHVARLPVFDHTHHVFQYTQISLQHLSPILYISGLFYPSRSFIRHLLPLIALLS